MSDLTEPTRLVFKKLTVEAHREAHKAALDTFSMSISVTEQPALAVRKAVDAALAALLEPETSQPAPAEHVMVDSEPPFEAVDRHAEIIAKIAEVANGVGWQAGEPAMELAGQIVSVLAAHPEHINRFMYEGTELFLDGTFNIENGSLTYRAINGSILSPSVIRQQKGTQQ